jgi:hypothetical protein
MHNESHSVTAMCVSNPDILSFQSTGGYKALFAIPETRQLFIRTHNKASSVLTLCGHNPK